MYFDSCISVSDLYFWVSRTLVITLRWQIVSHISYWFITTFYSHSIVNISETLIKKGIQRFKFHLVVFLSQDICVFCIIFLNLPYFVTRFVGVYSQLNMWLGLTPLLSHTPFLVYFFSVNLVMIDFFEEFDNVRWN